MKSHINHKTLRLPKYKFTVVIEKDEDGTYIVSCPAIQGCYSQGDTLKQAMANIKDTISLHIQARKDVGDEIPIEVMVDEIEVSV
jgi:predicted RNase H-like HicB family nuclease